MFTKLKRLIERNQLVAFFVIAFGYSWIFWMLLARFAPARSHEAAFYIPSIYGPTLSALILCLVLGGMSRLLEFLKQSLRWKVNIIWYIVALCGIACLLLLIRVFHSFLFPSITLAPIQLPKPALGILVGFIMSLPYGPFGEELGWRGFALPLLQKRMNALAASLVLGVLWWGWHLPQLLIPELQWAVGGMPPFVFLLTILPGAVLATWIYNNTGGSVLLTILFHGSMNYTMGLLGFNSPHFPLMMIAGLWVAAILVTLFFGPKRLSRQE